MPNDTLKPALRAALRYHEIGDASPYEISFAAKGNSGGSFGFMQGDLAAHQPIVHQTFQQALKGAGFSSNEITALDQRLSVHLMDSPLSPDEEQRVDAALLAGKALVDAMDEEILHDVYNGLDQCIAKAGSAGHPIDPKAQLYIAMWINMTGPPDKMLIWLAGGDPHLLGPAPRLGATVDEATIQKYLKLTYYYTNNPGNWPHMVASAVKGAPFLP
jgi:hypothetical protein